jgi:uncharacterized protein YndB with AHSA1/START domain
MSMETEYARIEHEIHVEASPEIVFEVISSAEHLAEWWPDEVEVETAVGAEGHIVFTRPAPAEPNVQPITIVELEPPHRFSFRWAYDEEGSHDNAMLVVFELEPAGNGTRVRMTETGFREQGWEAAELERNYLDHVEGWNYFIPRLATYASGLVTW